MIHKIKCVLNAIGWEDCTGSMSCIFCVEYMSPSGRKSILKVFLKKEIKIISIGYKERHSKPGRLHSFTLQLVHPPPVVPCLSLHLLMPLNTTQKWYKHTWNTPKTWCYNYRQCGVKHKRCCQTGGFILFRFFVCVISISTSVNKEIELFKDLPSFQNSIVFFSICNSFEAATIFFASSESVNKKNHRQPQC